MAFLDLYIISFILSYIFLYPFFTCGGMEDTDTTKKKGQNHANLRLLRDGNWEDLGKLGGWIACK